MPELLPSAHVDTFARDALPPADTWPELIEFESYPDRLNCSVALLDDTISEHGADRLAVIGDDITLTYGELFDLVTRLARVLTEVGVRPGNRVLLRSPNNARLMATWLAVLRIGGIVVTTMPMLRKQELDPIVEIGAVQYAVVDARYLSDWNEVDFDGLTIVVGSGDPDSLEERAAQTEPLITAIETSSDDVALLAFTSGTTGRPKATLHFHRDVLAIADSFSRHLVRPTNDDVFAGSPPIAFTFGLGALVIFPLRVGAASVMLEAGSPPNLIAAIEKHGITCVFTAPTAYKAMLELLDQHDVSSLRRCISAGETLPASIWNRWHDATGHRLIDGIGATEMLHIFISAADEESAPGFTGKVVPGYVAAVVDENLVPQPAGTPGRLAVKGPTGCRYLDDPRQGVYVQGGWNITGDVYVMDDEGRFTYLARADDMIISSGYNIAAPEVEHALLEHPRIIEAAVVGIPDDDRGHLVKAFLVVRECPADDAGKAALAKVLQDHVKATIAPYKYPRAIEFVDALPKTATGKLQRSALKQS